ncbi:hypothetical protein [Malacoplasma iowae]|uniref:hypothetical protein n=1 Tax=Malacoplasma iowae TaxID=2116 RepID=UPI00387347AD|nr:hypothetical protein QX181_00810 [Malacoplasma iowae]
MSNTFNSNRKMSRLTLNIIGLVAMGLLYIAAILVTAAALLKPDLNGIFANNKTGSMYAFSELISNSKVNSSNMLNGSASSSNDGNGVYTYTYMYTSNLNWRLSAFGIATIVIVGIALIYSCVTFIIFKVNKFTFANSKSLTVWNLGLPFVLVIYVFLITMLASPLGAGSWQAMITKVVETEKAQSSTGGAASVVVSTDSNAATETLKIVKTQISVQLIATSNDPHLSISNFYSLAIDASKLTGGDPTKTSTAGMVVAMAAAETNNGTALAYNGSLESHYSSGSMSILLGTVLVIAIEITFVAKLSVKLNKEFMGVVEEQPKANI